MQPSSTTIDRGFIDAFVAAVGKDVWRARLGVLQAGAGAQTHAGRQCLQRHCIELTLERLRVRPLARPASAAERCIAGYAADAVARLDLVAPRGRDGLLATYRAGLAGNETLVGPFHLLRTAGLQAARGYEVQFAGLEDGAPFDLLIANETAEAEVACDVISAEDGRGVHRGAWFDLVDRVDPELQTWLRAHPGRYLLKMTLPQGLKSDCGSGLLGVLHERITAMLRGQSRTDGDAAAVLRLDPLMLNAAQADELGLMPRLRREFGPEAHLSVTAAGGGVFVMAARAGQENEVAGAVRRRLDAIAPARLTGDAAGDPRGVHRGHGPGGVAAAAGADAAGGGDAALPDAPGGAERGGGDVRVQAGAVRADGAGCGAGRGAAVPQPGAPGGEVAGVGGGGDVVGVSGRLP